MNNYSFTYMLNVAIKHWIALVVAAVVTATAAFSYFNFIAEPKYSATGSVVVTNGTIIDSQQYVNNTTNNKSEIENSDVLASLNFADTVTDILKTPDIYKQLADKINGDYTFDELMARTTVTRRSDTTLFVDIEFIAPDKKEAVEILNAYLELAPEYINKMVKNASSSIVRADKSSWDYPSDIIIILFGGLAGAIVTYMIIFFIYSSSNVIRDEESFREHFDISIIGVVPDFAVTKNNEKKYGSYYGTGGNKNGK
ncbi:MAG: hypothetical protein IJO62_02915 [Clostridia bacterium]|nr:hypothetical protein [Clostridia bacterium]